MTDKFCKNLIAGIAGLIALTTYFYTVAPTVSFWDCGEFIASAHTLGIPHPPGRPFFVLFVRAVMICLPMVEEIAKRANYISAFASAAAVYLMVLFVWDLLAKLTKNTPRLVFMAASMSAGLLLTFSDTFWFNAVEAEVYNLIMFLMLLISYIALKYLDCKDEFRGSQYLVLICYLAFLGVGFHLFAMLVVPSVFILVLLAGGKPIQDLVNRWLLWVSGAVLCSVVYAISSFLVFSFILLLVLFFAWITMKKSPMYRDISLSLALTVVAIIGFSTHLYIPIRASLNPTINENNPQIYLRDSEGNLRIENIVPHKNNENWRAFYDYLERKQYGSESMISRSLYRRSQFENQILVFPHMGYGSYQIAQYTPFKPGEVSYYRQGIYAVDPENNPPVVRGSMKFPTLVASIGENTLLQAIIFLVFNGLLLWVIAIAFKGNKVIGIYLLMLYGFCSFGLLWYLNFADGTKPERRDHDVWIKEMQYYTSELSSRSAGMAKITNIPNPNELLRDQRKIYEDYARGEKSSQAEQRYTWKSWQKIQALFQSAGLQSPSLPDPVHLEVRNRDYFYTPAFVFMSLLYGLGIGFLLLNIQQKKQVMLLPGSVLIVLLCGATPLFANYKEHNRGNLWVPWDYAYNLLMSCEPDAILFTNGDNDTFPLWFAQEVAGIRKDVRVVNLSLGNTDWYIKQMLDNEPVLKLSYDRASIDRDMVLSEINYEQPSQRIEYWVNKAEQAIPTLTRQIEILNARLNNTDTIPDSLAAKPDSSQISKLQAELNKRELWLQVYTALKEWGEPRKAGIMQTQYKLVVDLAMNNLDKPIHVSTTVGLSNAIGLDRYMVQKGMVWDLIKGTLSSSKDSMDIDRTAYLVDSVFKYRGLGDGTTFINSETEQLLFNYNSMYIRLAMTMRDSLIIAQAPEALNLTSISDLVNNANTEVSRILNKGLSYVDIGIKQFPSEWRNYVVASELLQMANQNARAIEYLEKGLNKVPASSGSKYLLPPLNALRDK
jgi:hypothetical protein